MAKFPDIDVVLKCFERAKSIRTDREARMDQCFRYAMPGRGSYFDSRVFDDIDDVFGLEGCSSTRLPEESIGGLLVVDEIHARGILSEVVGLNSNCSSC